MRGTQRDMDPSEKIAQDHLLRRGYSDVVHEPDGNIPPHFRVDGRIAVEVRRFNQHHFDVTPGRPLEESEIPFVGHFRQLFASYGTSSVTKFINLAFQRPLPPWHEIEPGVRLFLDQIADGTLSKGACREVAPDVELGYTVAAEDEGAAFLLGAVHDRDAGGWLVSLFLSNLRLCIDEKTRKVAAHRSRYPEWWLVLVDYIGYGLSEFDRQQLREEPAIEHGWDKLVIVNPLDPGYWFEL